LIKMSQYLEKPGLEVAERLEDIAYFEPENPTAYTCRGVALWLRGKNEEALVELEQSIAQGSEEEDVLLWQAMVYVSLKRDEEARAALKKVREIGLPELALALLRWLESEKQ
jgi:tetratricopeptide (TPR) repeat protein